MREKYVETIFSSQNVFLLNLLNTVTCLLLIFWPKKAETKSIAHEQIYNNAHPKMYVHMQAVCKFFINVFINTRVEENVFFFNASCENVVYDMRISTF